MEKGQTWWARPCSGWQVGNYGKRLTTHIDGAPSLSQVLIHDPYSTWGRKDIPKKQKTLKDCESLTRKVIISSMGQARKRGPMTVRKMITKKRSSLGPGRPSIPRRREPQGLVVTGFHMASRFFQWLPTHIPDPATKASHDITLLAWRGKSPRRSSS